MPYDFNLAEQIIYQIYTFCEKRAFKYGMKEEILIDNIQNNFFQRNNTIIRFSKIKIVLKELNKHKFLFFKDHKHNQFIRYWFPTKLSKISYKQKNLKLLVSNICIS
jgi:hypothetical protein